MNDVFVYYCLRDSIMYYMLSLYLFREKQWVDLGLSNSVKIYKWVPGTPYVIIFGEILFE